MNEITASKIKVYTWWSNKYQSEHSFVFIPLTSMLLVSVVMSLLMWLWERY
jgi:hypothetical protein